MCMYTVYVYIVLAQQNLKHEIILSQPNNFSKLDEYIQTM